MDMDWKNELMRHQRDAWKRDRALKQLKDDIVHKTKIRDRKLYDPKS